MFLIHRNTSKAQGIMSIREFARRLHQGDYSIQAFVDLHGFLVEDATEVLEKFLKWAVTMGKTGVLIIHGRGFSFPPEPILKNKVIEWLTLWTMAKVGCRLFKRKEM